MKNNDSDITFIHSLMKIALATLVALISSHYLIQMIYSPPSQPHIFTSAPNNNIE
jgi:hypothetical protein